MDRLQALKQRLCARENTIGVTVNAPHLPQIVTALASCPLDLLVFDFEHGVLNAESAEPLLRAARAGGIPGVVRVQDTLPHLISKVLDMGADGVMLPRVESEEQVQTAVRSMRFFPRGRKGCGGPSLFRQNEKFDEFNDNRLLFIQIESYEGMDALPRILELYENEIACVVIGPYDLSIMTGTPLDVKCDKMRGHIGKIASVCRDRGVSCGIFTDSAGDMPLWAQLGINFFWHGNECGLISAGAAELRRKADELK